MQNLPKSPPVILAIGGSDSSAGAGIQADLKAIHSAGGYALTVVTGIVAESPHRVASWSAGESRLLREQLECVFHAYPIAAVKLGLLFNEELIRTVACFLEKRDIPVVLDPVGSASVGASFSSPSYIHSLLGELSPVMTLLTPNVPEAAKILEGCSSSAVDSALLAQLIGEKIEGNVLVKGGHSDLPETARDVLWRASSASCHFYDLPRLQGPDYHGTGCSLASYIATYLAHGYGLCEAVEKGKRKLYDAMLHGVSWITEGLETHALRSSL